MQRKNSKRKPEADNVEESVLMRCKSKQFGRSIYYLNARGVPTCIKRVMADALEAAAKLAEVNERKIWRLPKEDGENLNSSLVWQIFETPAVKDLWEFPVQLSPKEKVRRESKAKSRLRELRQELESLEFLSESDGLRLQDGGAGRICRPAADSLESIEVTHHDYQPCNRKRSAIRNQ
jgi:hypothetical protein